uniref:Integrase_H2C2 domain-containing protein n=1 Tax=Anopheles quadriannulatus TaxID=34691 RepID=A0A182XPU0_ANOQN
MGNIPTKNVVPETKKNPVIQNSSIRGLCPTLDNEGVMRSRGRLDHYDTRYPIILPKNHHVTRLILIHYHEKYYHKKLESALAAIRQKFWVIDLRTAFKQVISNCQHCKNERAKLAPPLMAPLPECRTAAGKNPLHTRESICSNP